MFPAFPRMRNPQLYVSGKRSVAGAIILVPYYVAKSLQLGHPKMKPTGAPSSNDLQWLDVVYSLFVTPEVSSLRDYMLTVYVNRFHNAMKLDRWWNICIWYKYWPYHYHLKLTEIFIKWPRLIYQRALKLLVQFSDFCITFCFQEFIIPGFQDRLTACANSHKRPCWMSEFWFWLGTMILLSWPYRWEVYYHWNSNHNTKYFVEENALRKLSFISSKASIH